jgi:hypothetical protein
MWMQFEYSAWIFVRVEKKEDSILKMFCFAFQEMSIY